MVQKFEAKDLSLPTKESDYSNFDQEPDSQIYWFQIKSFHIFENFQNSRIYTKFRFIA